ILAVGGGSVMDTAKAANVIFTHGGEPRAWEGYFGLPRDDDGLGRPHDLAPLACLPTTAGTGSEVSFAAVIKDRDEHIKVPIADRYREINELFGLEVGGPGDQVGQALAEHVRGVVRQLGLPTRLSEVGVPEEGIPRLVEGAEGDGCTLVNPRETTAEDFAELYRRAL